MSKKTPVTPPKLMAPSPSLGMNGKGYYTEDEVRELVRAACQIQIENCIAFSVHQKFGYYKFKPEELRKGAPLVEVEFIKTMNTAPAAGFRVTVVPDGTPTIVASNADKVTPKAN